MDFRDGLAGIGIQVRGLAGGLSLFFEFFITFIRGSFVMDCVRFFFVNGLFFHGARSREDRGLFVALRTAGLIALLGDGRDSVALVFVLFLGGGFLFNRHSRLSGPAESGQAVWFWTAEFLVPVGRSRSRLGVLDLHRIIFFFYFVDRPNIFVLLMERLGY